MAGLWNTAQTIATDPAANHTSTRRSPHQDALALRAQDDLVRGRPSDLLRLRRGDLEMAALAPVAHELRRAHPRRVCADRLVLRQEIAGQATDALGAP